MSRSSLNEVEVGMCEINFRSLTHKDLTNSLAVFAGDRKYIETAAIPIEMTAEIGML